jgi:hopanoid biosynthesis associated radical SAM protein HpnH
MSVPVSQMFTVASYVLRQRLRGRRRYPLVLMLEPLYTCNLSCAGCGKIQYPSHVLKRRLSVEECLRAVDECGAPMVSIPGGEPLLHPEIDRIVAGLVERRKYIYLCTNALLLEEKLDLFRPSRYLSFSVHLDGDEEEHDRAVCRPGTWAVAVRAIEAAISRGFRVTTNTTLFDGADPERTADFFDSLMRLGVEGMMVSPGYSYEKAPDQEHFLARERTRDLFGRLLSDRRRSRRWRFNQSPLFLEFLAGGRSYDCTPWSMPSYSVFGWQKPCYLLQDGYAESFDALLEATRWEDYGHASGNPRCRDCMVHSGFEASAVQDTFSSWRGLLDTARAFVLGPRAGAAASSAPARASASEAVPATSGAAALRRAFHYRGDVTLHLDDGSRVEGYLANLGEGEALLWRRGEAAPLRVAPERVVRVELSGRDHAARGAQALARRRPGEGAPLRAQSAAPGEGPWQAGTSSDATPSPSAGA